MKRRDFLKTSSLFSVGLSVFPEFIFPKKQYTISYQELIGKGHPQLFGDHYKLRERANEAFLKMAASALKSNIKIEVISSYRRFAHQNRIWERKYKQNINTGLSPEASINKIIEYSTIPGTSRHHWGTDLDLFDANVKKPSYVLHPKHFEKKGCFSELKNWMDLHANDFGFYLVYTKNIHRKGFKHEPWHYSFKPLSQAYLAAYKTLDIKKIITSENLMGGDYFSEEFITKYRSENILDINPELL